MAACAPLPSQYVAIRAYSGKVDYSYIQKVYQHHRDLIYNALNQINVLNSIYPEATFYCFVDIPGTGSDAENSAYQLLQRRHVAVVPENAYGSQYSDCIRIAFTLKCCYGKNKIF